MGQVGLTTTRAVHNVGSKGTKTVKKIGKTGTMLAKTTGATLFEAGKRATTLSGTLVQQLNQYIIHSHKNGEVVIPGSDTAEVEPFSESDFGSEFERELEDALVERFAEKLDEERAVVTMKRSQVTVDEGNTELVPRRVYHKIEVCL
jgi:hypothetical protein